MKIKPFLRVLTNPSCWTQSDPYSEEWDEELNKAMESHTFEYTDEFVARIGDLRVWISNHPYASFTPYSGGSFFTEVRPKRYTILAAMDKLIKDTQKGETMKLKDGLYVAKDSNGEIWAYSTKPTKTGGYWYLEEPELAIEIEISPEFFDNLPDLGPWDKSLHKVVNGELVPVIDRPDLKIDDKVWVCDMEPIGTTHRDRYVPRHFAGWSKGGRGIRTYACGRTSHTGSTSVTWSKWSLEDPNKEK